MSEFCLPSLGADMDDATITEWHIKAGDNIKRGDVIVAVETSKGIIDIEFFEDAVIDELRAAVGQKVAVGAVIATYHRAGESAASSPPSVAATAAPAPATNTGESRVRVSPAARRRARELHVDLEKVVASGPHGTITLEDIEKAASKKPVAIPAASATDSMRQAIAAAMVRSKREIPHYYLSTTIDMTASLDWLEQQNKTRPVTDRLLYSVLLVKAVALALKKTPELNGWWSDNRFKAADHFHIGMATSLRSGGLVVPTMQDVDKKNIHELMPALMEMVTRARSGHLRSSDLTPGSITITSLGEQGVEMVLPVIYPPQVAIVGFGAIVERPWSVQNTIVSRRLMTITLAADHRASDGQRGSRFLATLNQLLQEPEKLW